MATRIETQASHRGRTPLLNTSTPAAKAKRLPKMSATLSKAEGLNEEQNGDEDRDPGKPPRQDPASEHEHPCCESEETAEDVRDAIQGRRPERRAEWRRGSRPRQATAAGPRF